MRDADLKLAHLHSDFKPLLCRPDLAQKMLARVLEAANLGS